MKAITIERTGGPEVLVPADVAEPTAGPGCVVVDVEAAGVNFIDVYHRDGTYPQPLPFRPGLEGAGRVREVGEGVEGFAAGDLVAWKGAPGSYAERVVVPAGELVPVPAGVGAETAAAVMLQGLTAHYLATSTHPVAAGEWAVVHAAAGGVGLLLTQIVKRRGGHVLATTSTPDKADLARAAGADEVAGYDDFAERARELTRGRGVAVVYDGVGRATFDAGLRALRPRGTFVLFGGASGQVPPFDLQRLNAAGSLYVTRPTLAHYTLDAAELRARAEELFGWIGAGELDVRVGGRHPLAQARRAHEDLQARRSTGKLLLLP
ncbi:quinone oxidoreductase [Kineococcus glutinatus]|uniref:Quinone oxidoreductase n=1 Tax=Kineococcus glutinatus TaxID=1070872 RepID=A0ABP9HIP0_9ACTN